MAHCTKHCVFEHPSFSGFERTLGLCPFSLVSCLSFLDKPMKFLNQQVAQQTSIISAAFNASLEICVPQKTIERELFLKDPLFILNAHFGKTFSPLLLIDGNVRDIRVWYTL